MKMRGWSRRKFLLAGAGIVTAGAGGYWFARTKVPVGLIGMGVRGRFLAKRLSYTKFFPTYGEIVAIAGVNRERAVNAKNRFAPTAEVYSDYRQILERDDVRAVFIATPDHWHSLIAIHAMKAGKAVYCEKPLSLTIAEGQILVRTVKSTGSVFQVGTQQRSDWRFRTASELVRNGRLGTIRRISIYLPVRSQRESYGPFPATAPPKHLDWDAWLGQAPSVPFCEERYKQFRRWYEYSGGLMTDWGAHHVDIAQWAMGKQGAGLISVEGTAELPNIPNGFNAPLHLSVELRYSNDVSVQVTTTTKMSENGIVFEGKRGTIFVNRYVLEGEPVKELEHRPLPADAIRLHPSHAVKKGVNLHHVRHFLDCVITRKTPVSDVVTAHRTATACHLANISLRLGRKLHWNSSTETCLADPEANSMLNRQQREPYQIAG